MHYDLVYAYLIHGPKALTWGQFWWRQAKDRFQEHSIHIFSVFPAITAVDIMNNMQINISIGKFDRIRPYLTLNGLIQSHKNCTKASSLWVPPTHQISLSPPPHWHSSFVITYLEGEHPPSFSAPIGRREKRKQTYVSSWQRITRLFQEKIRSGQNWGLQWQKFIVFFAIVQPGFEKPPYPRKVL